MKKILLASLLLSFGPVDPIIIYPSFNDITCFFPKLSQAFTAYVEINSENKNVRLQLSIVDSRGIIILNHYELFTNKKDFSFNINLPEITDPNDYYDFGAYILDDFTGIADSRNFRITPITDFDISGDGKISGQNYAYYKNRYLKDEFYIKTDTLNSNLLDINNIELINTSSYFALERMPLALLVIESDVPSIPYTSNFGTVFELNTSFKSQNTLSFHLKKEYLLNAENQLYEKNTESESNKLFLPDSTYGETIKCFLVLVGYGNTSARYTIRFDLTITKKFIGNCGASEYCSKKSSNNNYYNFYDEFSYEVGA